MDWRWYETAGVGVRNILWGLDRLEGEGLSGLRRFWDLKFWEPGYDLHGFKAHRDHLADQAEDVLRVVCAVGSLVMPLRLSVET